MASLSSETPSLPTPNERLSSADTRAALTRIVSAWAFGAIFFGIAGGPVYVSFVRELGADDRILGILGASLPAMSFLQVVAARVLERTGKAKRQMLTAGLLGRGLWVFIATIPITSHFFPGLIPPHLALYFVVGGVIISSVIQAFTGPAFFSWMTTLVPPRVRPTFLARRMQMGTLTSLSMILLSGYIADRYPDMQTYVIILVFAACMGVMDIAFFFAIKEPPNVVPVRENRPPLLASLTEPLQDVRVRKFLVFVAVLGVGYGTQNPFLVPHCKDFLHLTNTQTSLLTTVTPMLGMMLSSRFWGEVIRRFGNRPVMRFCSACLVAIPIGWFFTTPSTWWMLGVVLFISGVLFISIELCNQNLMASLAPHVSRGTMTAVVSICGGTSFAIGSYSAGQVAAWLNGHTWQIGGFTFIHYHAIFAMSLAARLINAFYTAPSLEEAEAASTRDAIRDTVREVVPEIARDAAQVVVHPPLISRQSRSAARKQRKLKRMRREGHQRKQQQWREGNTTKRQSHFSPLSAKQRLRLLKRPGKK